MLIMVRKLFILIPLLSAGFIASAQVQTQAEKEKTQQAILKVLSKYKNPMSYYPLRRDIFLPDEKEIAKDELDKSYPEGARSLGHVVFISSSDSTYRREPFVDANGDLMDLSVFARKHYPSQKSNISYFRKKQQAHLNRYPSLGRFLYFNSLYDTASR
ncbi:MAG: hypothetical protein HEP71_23085 [Roseivirga sp.]|nr:hypothetical protein [Roseivirga sp.]